MRLARMSQEASSGTLPPANTRSSASQAAPKPATPATLPSTRRACLLSALPQRSMASTRPSGMSLRIVDSPKALGRATRAGISETGFLTVSPSPKLRASVATCLPRSASTSTVRVRTPTSGSRSCHAGPAQYRLPSTRTYPRLSARACAHLTASNGVPGSASMPARSSGSASAVLLPSLFLAPALMRPQPDASLALSSSSESATGTGTRRLRRRKPTAFSTDPFSFPE